MVDILSNVEPGRPETVRYWLELKIICNSLIVTHGPQMLTNDREASQHSTMLKISLLTV